MTAITEKAISSLDRSDMFSKMKSFPDQLLQGWEIGKESGQSLDISSYQHIVFSGMGGSAVAGNVIQTLLFDKLTIPFHVNRFYQAPGFLNASTLFVASSYSGNTEETLSSLKEAEKAGCAIVCLSSGGALNEVAEKKNYPIIKVPSGYPPRAALGFVLGILFYLFRDVNNNLLAEDILTEAVAFLQGKSQLWGLWDREDNVPLQIANKIQGRLPLIYGPQETGEVMGMRWKAQINENSKSLAFWNVLPELNHNEIMGWQSLPIFKGCLNQLIVLFIKKAEMHPRVQKRMEITWKIVEDTGVPAIQIEDDGPTPLARFLYLLLLGDFVSFYLAMINGVDPTEISNINHLKKKLMQ